MATDRIAYQLFKGRIKEAAEDDSFKTHPAALYREIAPLIRRPSDVGDEELARFVDVERHAARFNEDDRSRIDELRTVLAATDSYAGIGMKLFSEIPTDVRVIYFEGPDTASHLFMPFMPPRAEGVAAERVEWFGRVVEEFYAYQDQLLGKFLDAFANEETTIIVCSDHGFKVGEERPGGDSRIGHGEAAAWHARDGMVLFAGKDIRKGGRILGATVLDLVPTLLALYGMPVGEDMDGKILTAALAEEFLAGHPMTAIATYDTPAPSARPRVAGITEEDQELLARLESLGYVQQDKPTAHINQGTIHMQTGEPGKAIESFLTALKSLDKEPIRLNLARAYRSDGQPEKALEQLELLMKRGWRPEEVLAEMSALARERGEWKEAERYLKEALDENPGNARAHLQLARLYEDQGRQPEALLSYRRAAELDPGLAEAHNQLGVALQKAGRTGEAVEALRRAVEADPDLPGPYNNLGLLYRHQGKSEEARRILETGISMAPRSAILHNSLGSLHHDAGRVDEAIEAFERALEMDPDYVESLSNLAVAYQEKRDAGKTAEYLGRLLELEPDNHEARLSRALALLTQKRFQEATETLEALLGRDPQNVGGLIMLGEIHLRREEHRQAAEFLERASRLDGEIPRLWNDLARCYLALGRGEEARRALQRSLGLDPNQPAIARRLAEIGG